MAFARHDGALHDRVYLRDGETDLTVIGPASPDDTISLAGHGGGMFASFILDRKAALKLGQMLVEAAGDNLLAPCFRCKKAPVVDPNGGYPTVSCEDCYDGAPDSSTRSEVGSGLNRAQAVADWNEKMESAS